MTSISDKSIYVLRREYGKLNFGDYFYIKWTNNNFVFCNEDGRSLYNEDHYIWENQVFILSSKMMDKPVVLLGGAKFLSTNNKTAGLGVGFGSASEKHQGYDSKSYAVYCYNLPMAENISKLFLVQKNGKLIYTTKDENALWKTIEDIYKIEDETIFKITLTKMGWNISSIKTNTMIDIQTQYVTYNQKINRGVKGGNIIKMEERVTTLNNLKEVDIITASEIPIDVIEIKADDIYMGNMGNIGNMTKYDMRKALINKCFEIEKESDITKQELIFKKQIKDDEEKIVNHRKIVITNK